MLQCSLYLLVGWRCLCCQLCSTDEVGVVLDVVRLCLLNVKLPLHFSQRLELLAASLSSVSSDGTKVRLRGVVDDQLLVFDVCVLFKTVVLGAFILAVGKNSLALSDSLYLSRLFIFVNLDWLCCLWPACLAILGLSLGDLVARGIIGVDDG